MQILTNLPTTSMEVDIISCYDNQYSPKIPVLNCRAGACSRRNPIVGTGLPDGPLFSCGRFTNRPPCLPLMREVPRKGRRERNKKRKILSPSHFAAQNDSPHIERAEFAFSCRSDSRIARNTLKNQRIISARLSKHISGPWAYRWDISE